MNPSYGIPEITEKSFSVDMEACKAIPSLSLVGHDNFFVFNKKPVKDGIHELILEVNYAFLYNKKSIAHIVISAKFKLSEEPLAGVQGDVVPFIDAMQRLYYATYRALMEKVKGTPLYKFQFQPVPAKEIVDGLATYAKQPPPSSFPKKN